jgi:hypothetical protein
MGHPVWSGVLQLCERLLAVAVVVDVAGALQRNGVRRPGVALLGLGLTNSRLRALAGVGGGTAAHWIDHRTLSSALEAQNVSESSPGWGNVRWGNVRIGQR